MSTISQFTFLSSLLVMLALSAQQTDMDEVAKSYTRKIDFQGHRGARGAFPEHTIEGFEHAINVGVSTLELDVHFTKDKRFVIFHDHNVTNENSKWSPSNSNLEGRAIYELTSEQLQLLDTASVQRAKFPHQQKLSARAPLFLDEFLQMVADKAKSEKIWGIVRFNIEIKLSDDSPHLEKQQELVDVLLKTLDLAQVTDRCTIQSFYIPILKTIRETRNELQTAALFAPTRFKVLQMKLGLSADRHEIRQLALENGASILSPHFTYCSASFIQSCHASGLKVIPWTVNDTSTMEKLLKMGVDGIISDYPDRMSQLPEFEKLTVVSN